MSDQFANDYSAYLLALAEQNPVAGVITEPRGFFDYFQLNGVNEVQGHPEVFRNGEDFPITITHLTASVAYKNQAASAVVDERLIQRVGLYLNMYDQYYQNAPQRLGGNGVGSVLRAPPLPTWSNVPVGGPDPLVRGTSSWRFPKPFILSARDILKVRVRFYDAPEDPMPVTVSFTGIGLLSRQPYFLSAVGQYDDAAWHELDPTGIAYANDGAEPIMMTDMVVNVQAPITETDPTGDSRAVYVAVRQVGNGTGAEWFQGPINITTPGLQQFLPNDGMPGVLLGVKAGRAIVHQFPLPLRWEPGEGITAVMQALVPEVGDEVNVNLGLLGFITVT